VPLMCVEKSENTEKFQTSIALSHCPVRLLRNEVISTTDDAGGSQAARRLFRSNEFRSVMSKKKDLVSNDIHEDWTLYLTWRASDVIHTIRKTILWLDRLWKIHFLWRSPCESYNLTQKQSPSWHWWQGNHITALGGI
jgi:hypothetical protein